jgi:hypothetical protein
MGFVQVDDKNWEATFALVVYINREYDRGRFLKNGVFPSEEIWVNFLAELTKAHGTAPHPEPHPGDSLPSGTLSSRIQTGSFRWGQ